MPGSQDFAADPRNASLKVWLNGSLLPKDDARISVFDAGFVLGDGLWEGLRLHKGALIFLDEHLERLYSGAKETELEEQEEGEEKKKLSDRIKSVQRKSFLKEHRYADLCRVLEHFRPAYIALRPTDCGSMPWLDTDYSLVREFKAPPAADNIFMVHRNVDRHFLVYRKRS